MFDPVKRLLPRAVYADKRVVLLLVARDQGDEGCVQTRSAELLSPFFVGTESVGVQNNQWDTCVLFGVTDDLGEVISQQRLSAEDLQTCPHSCDVIEQALDVRHWEKVVAFLSVTHPAGKTASGIHLELDRPQYASHDVT